MLRSQFESLLFWMTLVRGAGDVRRPDGGGVRAGLLQRLRAQGQQNHRGRAWQISLATSQDAISATIRLFQMRVNDPLTPNICRTLLRGDCACGGEEGVRRRSERPAEQRRRRGLRRRPRRLRRRRRRRRVGPGRYPPPRHQTPTRILNPRLLRSRSILRRGAQHLQGTLPATS